MNIQQLKYIVAVAQTGTIKDAAKQMYVTQPSITKALKDLEEEMGIIIFNRTNRGVVLTPDGEVFLGYARQVLDQVTLIDKRYKHKDYIKQQFCVSCQHYSFAVNAFVDLIKEHNSKQYDFSIRETQTFEIIEDVARMKSEIGILYLSDFNEQVIRSLLKEHHLEFSKLFVARPHIFVNETNPLAKKKYATFKDLEGYPYLSFEQGEHNSFYFSEEMFSTEIRSKNIRVRDRATLFNLLIGLNGYTISSGVIDPELNGANIVAVPLAHDGRMKIGFVTRSGSQLSKLGNRYIEHLRAYASNDGVRILDA